MASFHMVIYHADCLHIGIYDRTAYELKTTFFQIFADSVREWVLAGTSSSDVKWLRMGFPST